MKKILALVLCFVMMFSVVQTSVFAADDDNSSPYKDKFLEYLFKGNELTPSDRYLFNESYVYYSNENNETPDWVLIYGNKMMGGPAFCYHVFDKWVMTSNMYWSPYDLSYFVYLLSEDKFYTLKEAWDLELEGKEKIFTEYLVPKKSAIAIGDTNKDTVIDVNDVTEIQRIVAKLTDQPEQIMGGNLGTIELKYMEDINRDNVINIKDATKLQRILVGLEE